MNRILFYKLAKIFKIAIIANRFSIHCVHFNPRVYWFATDYTTFHLNPPSFFYFYCYSIMFVQCIASVSLKRALTKL